MFHRDFSNELRIYYIRFQKGNVRKINVRRSDMYIEEDYLCICVREAERFNLTPDK